MQPIAKSQAKCDNMESPGAVSEVNPRFDDLTDMEAELLVLFKKIKSNIASKITNYSRKNC